MALRTLADLKALLDAEETALMREMLNHDCWVVEQRWVNDDAESVAPELHGPFRSAAGALAECERLRALGLAADRWTARHGEPVTRVVPVFAPDPGDVR